MLTPEEYERIASQISPGDSSQEMHNGHARPHVHGWEIYTNRPTLA